MDARRQVQAGWNENHKGPGGRFSLTLYSAEDVARLLMSPEILTSWRATPVSCPP